MHRIACCVATTRSRLAPPHSSSLARLTYPESSAQRWWVAVRFFMESCEGVEAHDCQTGHDDHREAHLHSLRLALGSIVAPVRCMSLSRYWSSALGASRTTLSRCLIFYTLYRNGRLMADPPRLHRAPLAQRYTTRVQPVPSTLLTLQELRLHKPPHRRERTLQACSPSLRPPLLPSRKCPQQ
ncbi:uncharacterized protein LAESUDRAFT_555638 [Laetiporus sulphureus 93-53]|uniref:Uncharacterized protein n=1 Tax=Laetiporus sulphureus 93-53 TaxID=1314785 RepID=A0A165B6R3_9APHY|nr:uncharacterized protein LAESUDRAFT_555638 [Laetiporus sulphureus 93-53]KZT00368.1 hypothetical protein LAESUDRAFT_555638 [Laetiporus sulphureus 93-53]